MNESILAACRAMASVAEAAWQRLPSGDIPAKYLPVPARLRVPNDQSKTPDTEERNADIRYNDAVQAILEGIRFSPHRPMFLSGSAGAGKSCALYMAAKVLAERCMKQPDLPELPLLLQLRGHAWQNLSKAESFGGLIRNGPAGDLTAIAKSGLPLIVLVDSYERRLTPFSPYELAGFLGAPNRDIHMVFAIRDDGDLNTHKASPELLHLLLLPLTSAQQSQWAQSLLTEDGFRRFVQLSRELPLWSSLCGRPLFVMMAMALAAGVPGSRRLRLGRYPGLTGLVDSFVRLALLHARRNDPSGHDSIPSDLTGAASSVCLAAWQRGFRGWIPVDQVEDLLHQPDLANCKRSFSELRQSFERDLSLLYEAGLVAVGGLGDCHEFLHEQIATHLAARHLAFRFAAASHQGVFDAEFFEWARDKRLDGLTVQAIAILASASQTWPLARRAIELLVASDPVDGISVIGKVGGVRMSQTASLYMQDPRSEVSNAAIEACARAWAPAGLSLFDKLCKTRSYDDRRWMICARALSEVAADHLSSRIAQMVRADESDSALRLNVLELIDYSGLWLHSDHARIVYSVDTLTRSAPNTADFVVELIRHHPPQFLFLPLEEVADLILRHTDYDLRCSAIRSMHSLHNRVDLQVLVQLLEAEHTLPFLLREAMHVLGAWRYTGALHALWSLLRRSPPLLTPLALAVVQTILKIDPELSIQPNAPISGAPQDPSVTATGVTVDLRRELRRLVRAYALSIDVGLGDRQTASSIWSGIAGPRGEKELLKLARAEHDEYELRSEAIKNLGRYYSNRLIADADEFIFPCLPGSDDFVAGVGGLGQSGNRAATSLLLRCARLESQHPLRLPQVAVASLSWLPEDVAAPALKELVLDRTLVASIRTDAMECLMPYLDMETLDGLQAIADEPARPHELWSKLTEAVSRCRRFDGLPPETMAKIREQRLRLHVLRGTIAMGVENIAHLENLMEMTTKEEKLMVDFILRCMKQKVRAKLRDAVAHSVAVGVPCTKSSLQRTAAWRHYVTVNRLNRHRRSKSDEK